MILSIPLLSKCPIHPLKSQPLQNPSPLYKRKLIPVIVSNKSVAELICVFRQNTMLSLPYMYPLLNTYTLSTSVPRKGVKLNVGQQCSAVTMHPRLPWTGERERGFWISCDGARKSEKQAIVSSCGVYHWFPAICMI